MWTPDVIWTLGICGLCIVILLADAIKRRNRLRDDNDFSVDL